MVENKNNPKIVNPRVRFAPSPTGFLHIGSVRSALFNYLFAKHYGGKLILRIEDTDPKRSRKEFEDDLIKHLLWLGLKWDEGPNYSETTLLPEKGYKGDYGPYRQSERMDIYKFYLEKLLQEGKAYYSFVTKEELEARRNYLLSIGQPPIVGSKDRDLPQEEVERYLKEGRPYIIRFKTSPKKIVFHDLIKGRVSFDSSLIGDFSIARKPFVPLYNFAVVVDDYKMKITHVIRGEEHLSNTPKQILVQEALGFPSPKYAHLPLILAPDGSKLSKRNGSTPIKDFKRLGYLPEALDNFVAFLGWNPGGEREIFSLSSLANEFSLGRCQKKSGVIFNIEKLNWINGFYIRHKSLDKLTELCLPYLIQDELVEPTKKSNGQVVYKSRQTGEEVNLEKVKKIIGLYKDRLKIISEISKLVSFFFQKNLSYDSELLKWKDISVANLQTVFTMLIQQLSVINESDWSKDKLREILMPAIEKFISGYFHETKDRGYVLWPLRVALTGEKASAGPFEIAELLGKQKTIQRLKEARLKIGEN